MVVVTAAAAPTEPPAPSSDPPAGPATGPGTGAAGRRGLRTTARDMVLSLLAVLALVAGVVLLVPRPNSTAIEGLDVAAAARGVADRVAFDPVVPDVPAGWTATSAELRDGTDGILTWHVGYLTDEGRYVGVEQAASWSAEWESILTSGGTTTGYLTVDDRTWREMYKPGRDVTSLLLRSDALVVLVTSKSGGVDDARALAASLGLPDA